MNTYEMRQNISNFKTPNFNYSPNVRVFYQQPLLEKNHFIKPNNNLVQIININNLHNGNI